MDAKVFFFPYAKQPGDPFLPLSLSWKDLETVKHRVGSHFKTREKFKLTGETPAVFRMPTARIEPAP